MMRQLRSLAFLAGMTGYGLPAMAQSIPVTIGGEASSLVGVDFDIPVQVDMTARTERLGSFAVRVTWNPAILQFISASAGSFGNAIINDSSSIGVLRIAGVNPLGAAGRVILGVGRFRPLTAASDVFRLTVLELYAATTYTDLRPFHVATDRAYCNGLGRWGDLDRDNVADSRDALLVLTASVGLPTPGVDPVLGDVDEDGVTNARDALALLAHGIGLPTPGFRILAVASGACGTTVTPPLALDPGDVTLLPAQAMTYYVTAIDPAGNAVSVAGLTWTSTNLAVATVGATGLVTAVAPGTTIIRGRTASDSVQATVTVVANRTTHWVDALAFNARNRLGTATLPFADIASAMTRADAGDTVRLRSARYQETVTIPHSLVLVGDTTAGGSRPVIVGSTAANGVVIQNGLKVVVRDLRFDTLATAIQVTRADTVVIRNVEFRAGASSVGSVTVADVGALFVQRSLFRGAGAENNVADNGLNVTDTAGLVVVDSSLFTDYGGHALEFNYVDSLVVRGNTIRNNYGFGVYVCGVCTVRDSTLASAVVLSRNRFTQNESGHVYVDEYRRAVFDHNVTSGGGYDGIVLYGFGHSRVSFRGDSIENRDDTYWIYASRFDSLSLDSVVVRIPDGYGYAYNGRIVTITDSKFLDVTNEALDIEGYDLTSQVVVRNVEFAGPVADICDFCGEGLLVSDASLDARNVIASNLGLVIDINDGDVDLRDATFTGVEDGIQTDCGSVRIDNVDFIGNLRDGTGVEFYGCEEADTLDVVNSSFVDNYYGVYANYNTALIRNSEFRANQYGLYMYYISTTVSDNVFSEIFSSGAEIYPDGGQHIAFLRNTASCLEGGDYFLYTNPQPTDTLTFTGNTVTDCDNGVYASGGHITIRGNTINAGTTAGGYGIAAFAEASAQVIGNAVIGRFDDGSIAAYASARAVADTNVLTGSVLYGIQAYGADTIRVRDNTITDHFGRCCTISQAAITIFGVINAATAVSTDVRRNRILRTRTRGIVLQRYFGDTVTVTVDSNAIRGADTTGIAITEYSKALVRYNAIDSNGIDAIRVSQIAGVVPAVLQFNNFTRSREFGVRNTGMPTTDAANNWWGDALGPRCLSLCDGGSAGDSVSANVTFSPFLTAPAATPVPAPPFLSVAAVSTSMASVPAGGRATPRVSARADIRHAARIPEPVARPLRRPRTTEVDARLMEDVLAADRRAAQRQAAREAEQRIVLERRNARRPQESARAETRARLHAATREASPRTAPPVPGGVR